MPALRLNGYERDERAALVAGRLAFLFCREASTRHAVVYLSPGGQVMVRGLPLAKVRGDRRVIGTYDRSVSIQQILDDVEAVERESGARA